MAIKQSLGDNCASSWTASTHEKQIGKNVRGVVQEERG